MTKKYDIKHPIDVHILAILMHKKYVRFTDLKTKLTDTNLLAYHIKKLQAHDYFHSVVQGLAQRAGEIFG